MTQEEVDVMFRHHHAEIVERLRDIRCSQRSLADRWEYHTIVLGREWRELAS